MTAHPAVTAVVIGIGNEFRRDDGVGLAVADRIRALDLPGVQVVTADGEPTRVIEAWTGAEVAVVVDAAVLRDPVPGRVHRLSVAGLPGGAARTSSHGLGVPEAVELATALGRMPGRLVVHTVEVAETGYGVGLSEPVAAAVPALVDEILRELSPPERRIRWSPGAS